MLAFWHAVACRSVGFPVGLLVALPDTVDWQAKQNRQACLHPTSGMSLAAVLLDLQYSDRLVGLLACWVFVWLVWLVGLLASL